MAMSIADVPSLYRYRSTALEENDMTATYTFDVFSSLDGYGAASGNWTGYWGKQGPELLDHRLALYGAEQRMVFGANTHRLFAQMLASSTEESEVRDPWVSRMVHLPATVVSTTLEAPLDWPNATVVSGDAVDVVARLKEESDVPLRSHGSLSLNRALMAAGLVDYVQVTLFPVITGQTGLDPIFQGAADFDLELVENRTLDGHIHPLSIDLYGFEEDPTCLHPSMHPARPDVNESTAARLATSGETFERGKAVDTYAQAVVQRRRSLGDRLLSQTMSPSLLRRVSEAVRPAARASGVTSRPLTGHSPMTRT
jgi:dihydrofolate reductase